MVLGVDRDNAAGADDEVVDVRPLRADREGVEDGPFRRQSGENFADLNLALRAQVPAGAAFGQRRIAEEPGERVSLRRAGVLPQQFFDDRLGSEPLPHGWCLHSHGSPIPRVQCSGVAGQRAHDSVSPPAWSIGAMPRNTEG